jgi:hypothetical protein
MQGNPQYPLCYAAPYQGGLMKLRWILATILILGSIVLYLFVAPVLGF